MKKLLLILLATILVMNCNKGGGGTKPPSIEEQIAEHLTTAWMKFEQADYDSAEYYFDEALTLQSTLPAGKAGKGWSKLMREDADLTAIETLFEGARSDSSLLNDVYAGLGIVNNLQKKYSSSSAYIEQLLTRASTYVFEHKTDITYEDMLVIQAHSYFYNKQFDQAYESLLELTTDYLFDSTDPDTWIVDSKPYSSYEGAISALLAILSNQYKSF
jgi:hypothetical protein